MELNDAKFTESIIQLEVLKERHKHFEDRIREQEKDLTQAYTDLGRKEAELEQIKDERDALKIKWEVMKKDLEHAQDSLLQINKKHIKRKNTAKSQAFFASLIFLISSVLVNLGTSMLVSTPPNTLGWVMLSLATAAYLIGALMTTLLALEGGN